MLAAPNHMDQSSSQLARTVGVHSQLSMPGIPSAPELNLLTTWGSGDLFLWVLVFLVVGGVLFGVLVFLTVVFGDVPLES